jgi:hypothetical protein
MITMAAAPDTKPDTAREHLARSRALRDEMVRAGNGVVYHLRRAAELQRRAARAARRNGR